MDGMIRKASMILIVLVIGMVCVAGCTSDSGETSPPTATPPTAVQTPVPTTQAAPDLVPPQPTDVVPSTQLVAVAASKDPITGDITVTFRGGKGQDQVDTLKVVVISGAGVTTTKSLKPDSKDVAVFRVDDGEATRGDDRVIVTVSYYDGKSYIIYDDVLSRN